MYLQTTFGNVFDLVFILQKWSASIVGLQIREFGSVFGVIVEESEGKENALTFLVRACAPTRPYVRQSWT